ncbi:Psi-producing oxygenase A [Penicillium chermesinum]|uniref:linoleate 8R-lipoxygenase n=1 Tax=Penicillium chermesinum TaxID=63820 RepID=A0A9W9NQ47_9EURO|nr:Psi-producing oxygenase A [Penicillium chermesinum]KAJ5224070.1 Psi-producing oxygenase A [Penicillium chermesinum]
MAEKSTGATNGSDSLLSRAENAIRASLKPLPTETGDGTYVPSDTTTGLAKDLSHIDLKDVKTLVDVAKSAVSGDPVNDREYIMERVIQLAADLPSTSKNGKEVTNTFLNMLWNDLKHPPISYLGRDTSYRKADGSGNNIFWPQIGAAGTPYARSVRPQTVQPAELPDPGTLFDSLLSRKEFKEHPNKISSVLFYLASIIIHGRAKPSQDFQRWQVEARCILHEKNPGIPPGVGVLLIMFNRFHNFVVTQLAAINQGGRFTKPDESNAKAYAAWDNDLFQTGRLVTCGLYINIVLKDYVRTILNLNRTNSTWSLDPRADIKDGLLSEAAAQATGNQVSAEFNLVYRWHSCISERDQKWSEDLYKEIFAGQDPSTLSLPEFMQGLGRWEASMPAEPLDRPFAKLHRQADGSFDDDDLVKIFQESVEDVAGAFGASNVPSVFRSIEVLGMQQARSWNLATLNEFRDFFNLAPYKTFEEINPDPYIADQLRHFYDHPDLVELYPGIIVEDTKHPVVPGSGLCTNYTISRAILSDAVALVRGDRFYTVDYTPKHLTNWAYNEINYDTDEDEGQVFYKLALRAFPHHLRGDSIYAHFPMVIPSENEKIMKSLGQYDTYNFDRPRYNAIPRMIESHAACKAVLGDQDAFKVTWGKKLEFLLHRDGHPYGRDYMLSGDLPPNAASRKMVGDALYRDKWQLEVSKFYEEITLQLIKKHSYKVAGTNQVDICRDVANLAQVHFCSSVFSLPLKTESNPQGIYTEVEMYNMMALIFTCIFYDVDVAKSFKLEQASRKLSQQLGELVLANVEVVDKVGIIASIVSHLHRHDVLSDYGVHMIQRLLDSKLAPKEIVWTHILPSAAAMVANQAQLFTQALDFYLDKENAAHLAEIQRLSTETTPESDDLLLRYFMEGARIRSSVALPRKVAKPTVIEDKGEKVTLKTGQEVFCNLSAASHDPEAFPDPETVRLDRDLSQYIFFGYGPHQCLGLDIVKIALPTMFRVGQLKKVPGVGGITMYLDPEYSSYSPYPSSMKIQWDGELP